MIGIHIPALWFSSGGDPATPEPGERSGDLDGSILAAPVLIVEDEAMIAWMMESLLEDMGFTTIQIAATGEEAVSLAAQLAPRLVISDINLGRDGIDGIQAATAMRGRANPSVVFISAYVGGDASARIERDVPGASLLRKPVDFGELRRAIAQVIARRDLN